jgi:hypothetical protein
MQKIELPTGATPDIIIRSIGGDLNLKGHMDQVVVIKSLLEEAEISQTEQQVNIRCPADCTIYVPHQASIRVDEVLGRATLKSLAGKISIGKIHQELVLRDVSEAKIDLVGADLSAKYVHGDLAIDQIGRTAIIRRVDGQFSANQIGAHLNLREVSGSVVINTGGNADVYLTPKAQQMYRLSAGGNINCRLVDTENARIFIRSGAQRIHLDLPDHARLVRKANFETNLGEDGPEIHLEAGGSVELRSRASGWETIGAYDRQLNLDTEQLDNLAEQIEIQVTSQIEALTDQVDAYLEHLELGIGQGLNEDQRRRITERIQRAEEHARQASTRARMKWERKLEAARRKMEKKSPRPGIIIPPVPPVPSPGSKFIWPPSSEEEISDDVEAVTEDERLMILKMLEEKVISAEEAEQLLAALGEETE